MQEYTLYITFSGQFLSNFKKFAPLNFSCSTLGVQDFWDIHQYGVKFQPHFKLTEMKRSSDARTKAVFRCWERYLCVGYRGVARDSRTQKKLPVFIDKFALGTPRDVEKIHFLQIGKRNMVTSWRAGMETKISVER